MRSDVRYVAKCGDLYMQTTADNFTLVSKARDADSHATRQGMQQTVYMVLCSAGKRHMYSDFRIVCIIPKGSIEGLLRQILRAVSE